MQRHSGSEAKGGADTYKPLVIAPLLIVIGAGINFLSSLRTPATAIHGRTITLAWLPGAAVAPTARCPVAAGYGRRWTPEWFYYAVRRA